MMDSRQRYAIFCAQIPDLPVFMEPWYLDALAPGWQVVLLERGGMDVAAWPYYPKKKGPFRYVTMPLLVRMMGPVFHPDFDNDRQRYKLIPALSIPTISEFPDILEVKKIFLNWFRLL